MIFQCENTLDIITCAYSALWLQSMLSLKPDEIFILPSNFPGSVWSNLVVFLCNVRFSWCFKLGHALLPKCFFSGAAYLMSFIVVVVDVLQIHSLIFVTLRNFHRRLKNAMRNHIWALETRPQELIFMLECDGLRLLTQWLTTRGAQSHTSPAGIRQVEQT